jgi:ribokinase
MTGNVIVVGSLNVDLIIRVPHLPRPGETVTGGTYSRGPGGKGANAAAAAAALGARTWIVGVVGDDELGSATREDLAGRGVDLSQLHTGARHTGVAGIMVEESGENLIAVAPGANHELSAATVRASLAALAGEVDEAVVTANLEIPEGAVEGAAVEASERRWPFVLNPAPARPLTDAVLAACTALTPNQHEIGQLAPGGVDQLLERGVRAVVVTRGSGGADLHRPGREPHHQPAFPVARADTTGAGDAFTAALAWALSEGRDIEDAVRAAAAAGALATRAVGARSSLPHRDELERLMAAHP